MKKLNLNIDLDNSFNPLEETYRNEGLSVGPNHMRIYGENIKLEVSYSDLIIGEKIGQGACSSVNLARHKRTGEIYAVKLFSVFDKHQESQLYNEISLLVSFQCDALVSLKGAFHDQGSIGLIIEYMDKGSLEFLMDKSIFLDEKTFAAIAFQIIWGLGYLHFEKQIHRDIKPGNILMNSKGQVKLSDFGISKELDNSKAMSHTAVGSYRYMSPERLSGEKYDASGDIWSVGVTLIQLWNKKYPFLDYSSTPIELYGHFRHLDRSSLFNNYPASIEMQKCIKSMLESNPSNRTSSSELMQSPWFQSYDLFSLEDSQSVVERWIKNYERRSKKSLGSSIHAEIAGSKDLMESSGDFLNQSKLLSKDAKDIYEMSISFDNSCSIDDNLSVKSLNNPYTTQPSNSGAVSKTSHANKYKNFQEIGEVPIESKYEDDFEEFEEEDGEVDSQAKASFNKSSNSHYYQRYK